MEIKILYKLNKIDSDRIFLRRFWLKNFDPYFHYCRLDGSISMDQNSKLPIATAIGVSRADMSSWVGRKIIGIDVRALK